MPIRKTLTQHIVHRDGKQFTVPAGKKFAFTVEELADIMKVAPDSVSKLDEGDDVVETVTVPVSAPTHTTPHTTAKKSSKDVEL